MKAITADRLSDGAVLYVGDDRSFVDRFEQARLFEPGEAEKVLAQVLNRKTAIASAYLIEAEATGPIGARPCAKPSGKTGRLSGAISASKRS